MLLSKGMTAGNVFRKLKAKLSTKSVAAFRQTNYANAGQTSSKIIIK
jgi:hypothetical protein